MSEELKLCPFCGGKPQIDTGMDLSGLKKIKIKCKDCFIRTGEYSHWNDRERRAAIKSASEIWNKRA